jgi:hypothetical protein
MNEKPPADLVAIEKPDFLTPLIFLAIAGFFVWLGIRTLDPAWATGTVHGRWFVKFGWDALVWLNQHASPIVRLVVVFGLTALSLLVAVLVVLDNLYGREKLFIVDADGIESLSEKGKGRLSWKDIATVRVADDVVRVNGAGGKDIGVGTDEIDKDTKEIFAAIARHRPEVLPAENRPAGASQSGQV